MINKCWFTVNILKVDKSFTEDSHVLKSASSDNVTIN